MQNLSVHQQKNRSRNGDTRTNTHTRTEIIFRSKKEENPAICNNMSEPGKGVRQGCILPPCLFNFYAEYMMRNAGLEETQAGIKIARRNINNLKYADDTTLMAESEEELKSLLMKVKEESE